jgi:O-antigen/teichoic acid export membrane protein
MLGKIRSKLGDDKNLSELLSGSAITFVLKMTGMLLGYVAVYLISIKNGAEGVGYYGLINQTLLIVGLIAASGTNVSVLRFVGQYDNDQDRPRIRDVHRAILKLIIPFSIIAGVLLYFSSEFLAQRVFSNPEYARGIQVVAVLMPLYVLDHISIELIRGFKKLMISEFARAVIKPLTVVTTIWIYFDTTIPNIYIIYFLSLGLIASSLLSNSAVLFFLNRIKGISDKPTSVKEVFSTSSPMMISAVSGILMTSVSLFVLEYFESTSKVGVYSVSLRLAQLIAIVLIVVNTISAPKFAELYWAKKNQELQKIIRQSTKLMFWGALLLSALLAIGSPWILRLFGSEFTEGQMALWILIFGQLINAATGSVGLFLNMSGHQNILRNTALISLALQVVLAIILIPMMGLMGAAIATSSSGIIWNLMCILYVKKKLNIKTYYFFF